MQPDVVSVAPETSLLDVHRLFVEEEIGGAPVVDDEGRVLGVISAKDLLRAVQEEYGSAAVVTAPDYLREELPYSGPDWIGAPEDFQDRMTSMTAADSMVRGVISVGPDATVQEIARLMRERRIHRVFVVNGEELVGIVTTFDLVRLLEGKERRGQLGG
jgi:CBS domain-containing protein